MKSKLYQQDGTVKGEIDLPDSVFGVEFREHLVYQVVKSYLANKRQGTANAKGRAEVSGGGRKPWRQKGTGRARAGSNTSPVWSRGGKAHGPEPRDYSTHIPRRLRKSALAAALSARAAEEQIVVVESLTFDPPKTKAVAQFLDALSLSGGRNLLVLAERDKPTWLAARNIPDLSIKPLSEINAYDVLGSDTIIFGSEQCIGKLEQAVAS
jgi:large subunit ribosomal protein L4